MDPVSPPVSSNGGNAGTSPAAAPSATSGSGVAPSATPDPNSPVGVAEAGLKQSEAALDPVLGPVLSTQGKKQTPKVKKKAEGLIGMWLSLAQRKPEIAPGRDVQALYEEFQFVEQLKVVLALMRGLTVKVDSTILAKLAEVWKAVLAMYAIAQRLPADDAQMVDALSQMQAALAIGPRTQKTTHAKIANPIPKGKKAAQKALLAHATVVVENGNVAQPASPAAPAPATTVPEPPAGNSPAGGTATPSK